MSKKIIVENIEIELTEFTLVPEKGEDLLVLEVPAEFRKLLSNFPFVIEYNNQKFQKYFAYYYLKPGLSEKDLSVMWDYLAKDYDQHVNITLNTAIYKIFKREINKLYPNGIKSVLDYGVGTGKFLLDVFKNTDIKLMGADVSKEMCNITEQRGIATSIIIDSKTNFPANSTIAICACYVIHLFGKDISPYKEWYRLLDLNGIIIFNHRNPVETVKEFFNHNDFIILYQEILQNIGFKNVTTWLEKVDLGQEQFKELWFTSATK
jgi:ubiquinone/menaquinone biosynthesis C-methylase UbiE